MFYSYTTLNRSILDNINLSLFFLSFYPTLLYILIMLPTTMTTTTTTTSSTTVTTSVKTNDAAPAIANKIVLKYNYESGELKAVTWV